jgi:UPF0042 nucleotide-binding protein
MQIYIHSFGYAYGPKELGGFLTIDCRILPDPGKMFGVNFDGRHAVVKGYLKDKTKILLQGVKVRVLKYLKSKESEKEIRIRFGCTGGLYRSVYVAEEIGQWLRVLGHKITISHLDISRYK